MATRETTTTYRWDDASIIRRIDVRQQKNGAAVAYIYADTREEARAQRQEIRAALRLKGWGTLSDHRDGEFSLRVSGFSSGEELIRMLQAQGSVSAPPQIHTETAPEKPPGTLGDFIRTHSLRAAALLYMLGNGLYYMGGIRGKDPDQKRMAVAFGAGDAMLGVFGGADDGRQFKSLLTKLKQHMDTSGIEIPKTAAIHVETSRHETGALANVANFLHIHINPIKIAAEVVGGFFALRTGLKKDSLGKRNPLKVAGGVVVMAGWAAALGIKEKKPDEAKLQDAGFLERAAAYIQEKPLRLAGWAGLAYNSLTLSSALRNRGGVASAEKKAQAPWDLAAVGAMVAANGLYSISNKTTGGSIKTDEMVSDVYAVAAQILNKQPGTLRETAMESTAKFLGDRPEIKDTHAQIIARLKEEMAIQRQNPWYEPQSLAPYTPVPKLGRLRMGGAAHAAVNDNEVAASNDNEIAANETASLAPTHTDIPHTVITQPHLQHAHGAQQTAIHEQVQEASR